MQQPGSMFPVMPSFPPTNITTEQIQKVIALLLVPSFLGHFYDFDKVLSEKDWNFLFFLISGCDFRVQWPNPIIIVILGAYNRKL